MGAVHALRIKSPYKLLHVEDIEITYAPNEHGKLYLKCLLDDSINFKYSIEASTKDEITVYEEKENNNSEVDINNVDISKSVVIFNGIVENIKTTNKDGLYYIEIEGISKSSELDMKEKSRSFQNINMTYDELIKIILNDYSGFNFIQCIGQGQAIKKPIFQYKETDWNFLKRVASELKSEIYCDIIDLNNTLYFGINSGNNHELQDDISYKACKDLKTFYKAGGYELGFHDTDYFYYKIKSRERYNIGDNIYFKQKDVYVSDYEAYKYQDEIIYKYKLRRKNGVWQTKIYNSLLCGASLEGKVLAVEGEEVKLHLSIDENQDEGEGSRFKYAPPTGNTMYSMPVVGTSARLYFPDESGNEPLVSGCVRSNGSSCAKTSDTTKRYFGTEHGSELEMTPSALNIKGGSASPISISIDDSVGIKITSPKKLTLSADSEIIMKTPKNVKINGVSQISALKSNTQSGFSLETDLHFLSDNVINNGSSSESYPDFDDEPQAGTMPEPEPPKEEKKGFNWGLLAVVAIATVAVVASVATFGLATTVGVMAIGAIAGSAVVGAYNGAKNSIESQKAANGDVDCLEVIKAGFTGAVTGAKDMVITEACVAYDTLNQTASSIFDICTCGTFHNKCEDFSEWSHKFFKDKAPYKNSYEFEQYLLNVALIADGAVKFGNMIDGIASGSGGFTLAFEGGYGESFAGAVPSIAVSAGEIGSMAVGGGAFYNVVKNNNNGTGRLNQKDEIGSDGLTSEQRKKFKDKIKNSKNQHEKDLIEYERNKVSRENRGLDQYDSFEDWYKDAQKARNSKSGGYDAENDARKALSRDGYKIDNNNTGKVETTKNKSGNQTRPDGLGTNSNGDNVVHEHKHFVSAEKQEVYLTEQIQAEEKLAREKGAEYVITMSSNSELVTRGNVLQPKPIPSGPLSQSIQNINGKIYYVDINTKTITYEWSFSKNIWIKR
ncbi:hypothetical protein HYH39_01405 [Clostridium botulinum]|nr:hypothetical protein [Clostridium botulinum]MBY6850786.1 hypothetical protein [Clostridium botulinum]